MTGSILWRSLSREADRAATKCSFCHEFGHVTSDCPKLEHIQKPGITVERSDAGNIGLAFGVCMILIGFFMGVCAHKLVEAFIQ